MKYSNHGVVRSEKGEEQPADKDPAQTAHQIDPRKSATREATRDRPPHRSGKYLPRAR
jgi:hypothetical protein